MVSKSQEKSNEDRSSKRACEEGASIVSQREKNSYQGNGEEEKMINSEEKLNKVKHVVG